MAGAAHLVLAPGVALLHPEEAVVEAMLAGWRVQQQSRCLAAATISDRLRLVSRFWEFAGEYPWQWTPANLEAWTVSLLSREQPAAHSTVRAYQQAIAMFLDYIVDARYGWSSECEERFGRRPAQISHEWNTAAHRSEYEGRPGNRPFTRDELQAFFDFCDEQVDRAERFKRKGWLAAFRDATLFKVLYGWGLRRNEGTRLDVCDFTANPVAPEFGRVGMLSVRYGKASRGGPPRRRNVCTVFGWAAEAVEHYVNEVRPLYGADRHPALWLTERGGRVSSDYVNLRFAEYRTRLGLPEELGPHCLRHSYVTHLIEDGFDALFVQQQVGHAWASTTALYTGVSSDFKNQALRAALDRAFATETDVEEAR